MKKLIYLPAICVLGCWSFEQAAAQGVERFEDNVLLAASRPDPAGRVKGRRPFKAVISSAFTPVSGVHAITSRSSGLSAAAAPAGANTRAVFASRVSAAVVPAAVAGSRASYASGVSAA